MKDANRVNPAQLQVQQTDAREAAQPSLVPSDLVPSDLVPSPAADDGIDRRNFLSCMAWAGTGLMWTMAGGVPSSRLFAATGGGPGGQGAHAGFSFVQISDSHIGFNKAANQDVTGTLKLALDKINALPPRKFSCCANRGGRHRRRPRIVVVSPVPKSEGPGAPSSWFEKITGTGATRLAAS